MSLNNSDSDADTTKDKRAPKPKPEYKEYTLELRNKEWKRTFEQVAATIKQTQELLVQPDVDKIDLLQRKQTIDIQYADAMASANAVKQLITDHADVDAKIEKLKSGRENVIGKIAAATKDFKQPEENKSEKAEYSKASSSKEETARLEHEQDLQRREEALDQERLKLHQEQKEAWQEIERHKEAFWAQQEQVQQKIKEEQHRKEAELKRKERELQQMKTQAYIAEAKARCKVEEDEDTDDSDEEQGHEEEARRPTRQRQGSTASFSNRRNVEANLDPSRTSEQDLLANLAHAFLACRLPVVEPPVFSGNPLYYNDWVIAFEALIGGKGVSISDRMFYLQKYLSGAAKEAVRGYFALHTERNYMKARKTLEERFGNPFIISESFYNKLATWPRIAASDYQGLQKFSDFLQQTEASYQQIDMKRLNDMREISKIAEKLPTHLLNQWNKKARKTLESKGRYPKFSDLNQFVYKQSELYNDPVIHCMRQKAAPPSKTTRVLAAHVTNEKEATPNNQDRPRQPPQPGTKNCVFCYSKDHYLPNCPKFAKESIAKRLEFLKESKRCYRCLRRGHMARDCNSPHKCDTCKGQHPTCLHDHAEERSKARKHAHVTSMKVKTNTDSVATTTSIVPVLLSSKDKPDHEILTYAILDSGSDATFIEEDTLHALDPPNKVPTMLTIETVNNEAKREIESHVQSNLRVRGYNCETYIDLPPTYSIPEIPTNARSIPTSRDIVNWPHLRSLKGKVPPPLDCGLGLLIGHNCWQALIPRDIITGRDEEPFALKTTLGWSILGPSTRIKNDKLTYCNRIITEERPLLKPADACSILERDFKEESGEREKTSQDDIKFVQILENSIEKNEEGYLEMPLPFRNEPNLPSNRQMAVKRLEYLKRKLLQNKELKQDYVAFMQKFIDKGDAEETCSEEDQEWYLPHHGVYHPKKRKLRVVFDCSASYKGTSLNDHLLAGPNLINDLAGVFMRFRKEEVALTCDIEAMFHQFRVVKHHRRYLKFLWYKNGDITKEPTTYRMCVHLFGATSSPACANFGMKHMAKLNEENHPKAADFIKNNFYVDDGLVSVPSSEEAIKLVNDSTAIFKENKLRLHKFASNNQEVINAIPASERSEGATTQHLQLSNSAHEKTLGMEWLIQSDEIHFTELNPDAPATRRGILSTVASLYDPLGFLAPFALQGKRILQEACQKGTKWDDKVEGPLLEDWQAWRKELQSLQNVRIPRCYHPHGFGTIVNTQLHHFSDASQKGYGMCTYLRFENEEGQIHCAFVAGKSRVAPTKIVSIPRLELTAAALSAKIGSTIKRLLKMKIDEEHFWTDSNIVLGYINNEAKRFHTFVANRVQKIKDSTDTSSWHHVSTKGNPADLASRGQTLSQIPNSCWLRGPEWLWQRTYEIPTYTDTVLSKQDPEVRIVLLSQTSAPLQDLDQRLSGISRWTRARRIVARILRLTSKEKIQEVNPTPRELSNATNAIISSIQQQFFPEEHQRLSAGKNVKESSPLASADPILIDGVIRVGGRIQNQDFPFEERHPVILPKCHTSFLIISHCHALTKHQGKNTTLNEIKRQGYHIIGASSSVTSLLRKCTTCKKLRGEPAEQKMADLPQERTESTPPFTYVGMDCFGPFTVKNGRKESKRYGLLFTCMCSRAVHVEMLDDMSTDCFINGLRCFQALRGPTKKIFCDQGTNFVGADNEFKKNLKESLQTKMEETEFEFNVPHAPHCGGVWERQVKTVKSVLKSISALHPGRMDDASLRTFLYEAMAIVNSRPLTAVQQSDPTSPAPLSPNHILTSKTAQLKPPPGEFQKEDAYLRKRWRRVQFLLQQFWSRWRREYLAEINKRNIWRKPRRNLQEGDIVLVVDENAPRNQWTLGIVTNPLKSNDGLVRKAAVKIGTSDLNKQGQRKQTLSVLERPVQKLILIQEAKPVSERDPQ